MLEHHAAFYIADARIAVPPARDAGGGLRTPGGRFGTPSTPDRAGSIRPRPPAAASEGEEFGVEERPLPLSLRLAFIVTASLALWAPIVAAARALI